MTSKAVHTEGRTSPTILGRPTIRMTVQSALQASLVVTTSELFDSGASQCFDLGSNLFTIGRREDSSLCLPSGAASYSHASIQEDTFARLHALTDNHSSNGTAVNGLYVRRTLLHDGDCVEFPDARAYYLRRHANGITSDLKRLTQVDDGLRQELMGSNALYTVFWIKNYQSLTEAFDHTVLRAISEHLVSTLSQVFPFARIESLRGGFEYVLVTDTTDRALGAESLHNALHRLSVASIDNDRNVALTVEAASSTESSLEATERLLGQPRPTTHRVTDRPVAFNWVHLSDLHVGAGNLGWRADHEQVIAAMLRDLKERSPRLRIDRLIVTGDISFSGTSAQFAEAMEMLRMLAGACEVGLEHVRLVPGNHDVQRDLAGMPVTRALHMQVRQKETLLDTYLADQRGRTILAEKLAGFSQFVDAFPGHPRATDALDWIEECAVGERLVRIFGLCSVWISDSLDGQSIDRSFLANLALSQRAVMELAGSVSVRDATLVLTHHPVEWLMPHARRWLQDAISANAGLHLCGHVHGLDATQTHRSGGLPSAVMSAGAAHAGPEELPVHSYSWGSLMWNPRDDGWELGWSPRVFVPARGEMRPDRMRYDLDDQGFCWLRLPSRDRARLRPASRHEVHISCESTSTGTLIAGFEARRG